MQARETRSLKVWFPLVSLTLLPLLVPTAFDTIVRNSHHASSRRAPVDLYSLQLDGRADVGTAELALASSAMKPDHAVDGTADGL